MTMRNQGGGKARYFVGANTGKLAVATTLECLMDEARRTRRTYVPRRQASRHVGDEHEGVHGASDPDPARWRSTAHYDMSVNGESS
jgi:hypothetical protein